MMIFVVACGAFRFLPTLPPKAKRSGRDFALPPEMVIGVDEPAFFFGRLLALYIEDDPQDFPAVPPRRLSRAFCEALA
jgi:hypothetical protein